MAAGTGAIVIPGSYRAFWHAVGSSFPDLGGAASTAVYASSEQRLFREYFPPLAGLRILKTDLWDEAKNTRILAWAASHGARAIGIDLSEPIVRGARAACAEAGVHIGGAAVGDVRALPFTSNAFDAIYSMGTVEHFAETPAAIAEIARVLAPGGRAIIGVPNRHDPFLRPALSAVLQAAGAYAYGYERAYSRRALRTMIEAANLRVLTETGILFMPGWLRMADVACYVGCRPLARVTAVCVRVFALLERVPALRRHGYLLATVATKMA